MDFYGIKEAVESIQMPKSARARICAKLNTRKEFTMKKHFTKASAIAAVLALCICIPMGAMASGKTGFYKDKVNHMGAITGQTYENATDEIRVTAEAINGKLLVTAEFLQPEKAPYFVLKTLSLGGYTQDGEEKDENGLIQAEATMKNIVPISENKATFILPLNPGATKLHITSFEGGSKADQDLTISGNWEITIS